MVLILGQRKVTVEECLENRTKINIIQCNEASTRVLVLNAKKKNEKELMKKGDLCKYSFSR